MESSLEKLYNSIENSSLYKEYKKMEEILEKDENIKNTINEIKELEKLATHLEHINDPKYKEIDKQIKEKSDILKENPIYQEYLNKMEDFNDELSQSSKIINDYLKDIV